MFKRAVSISIAAAMLTFGAVAGGPSNEPGRIVGFGPAVMNDPTLNANLGVLRQEIAWLNSRYSDIYEVAQPAVEVEQETFDQVAMLSSPSMAVGHFPAITDDRSLDRSNGILSQVIAWQNSPGGDAFMVAQAEPEVTGADFQRVALASIPVGSDRYTAE